MTETRYLLDRKVDWWGVVYPFAWLDRGGDVRRFDVHMDRDAELPREEEDRQARESVEAWLARYGPAMEPLVPLPLPDDPSCGL